MRRFRLPPRYETSSKIVNPLAWRSTTPAQSQIGKATVIDRRPHVLRRGAIRSRNGRFFATKRRRRHPIERDRDTDRSLDSRQVQARTHHHSSSFKGASLCSILQQLRHLAGLFSEDHRPVIHTHLLAFYWLPFRKRHQPIWILPQNQRDSPRKHQNNRFFSILLESSASNSPANVRVLIQSSWETPCRATPFSDVPKKDRTLLSIPLFLEAFDLSLARSFTTSRHKNCFQAA